jgi:hypothetical protein
MIVKITNSPKPTKRFRVFMDNGKTYDFGYENKETGKTGHTYIDGASENTKFNYLARHLGNKTERKLIMNLVPSPSMFSALLLWGNTRSIKKNAEWLNKKWKQREN